jgi:hypothetical protein
MLDEIGLLRTSSSNPIALLYPVYAVSIAIASTWCPVDIDRRSFVGQASEWTYRLCNRAQLARDARHLV